jgi:transposase
MGKPRILKPCRRQAVIKVEAPEDLIAKDHPARLIARVVDGLDLSKFTAGARAVEHGSGRPTLCPATMLTLWLYATSRGIGSAREIERLVGSDDAFKWIVGDLAVGRFAISEFRVSHGEALLSVMADVLGALLHKRVLSPDVIALDGTRVRASASAPSFRRLESLRECREQALLHIRAVLADADNPEITARQHAARAAAAKELLRRTDEAIKTATELAEKRRREARASTTDANARVMKMPDGGFRPAYNVQVAVAGSETGGPRTIVAIDVTNVGSDMGAIEKMIPRVEAATGVAPARLLADGNHARHACIDYAHARGVLVYAPPSRWACPRTTDTEAVRVWRERMATDDAKRIYRGRAALAELPNAFFKSRFGFDRVRVRGVAKVTCVAVLAAVTFNIIQNAAHFA